MQVFTHCINTRKKKNGFGALCLLFIADDFIDLDRLFLWDSHSLHLQAFQVKSNISRFSGFVWHENEVNCNF